MSGGLVYLGGGTPIQKACGYEDSAENLLRYLEASADDSDPEKFRLYAEGSVAHECGIGVHVPSPLATAHPLATSPSSGGVQVVVRVSLENESGGKPACVAETVSRWIFE